MSDADEFLMGGGLPAVSFKDRPYGTTYAGRITDAPTMQQQRDFQTGELKVWPDSGRPMMQLVVPIQTDQRDPSRPADDGVRGVYVKGQMREAIAQAVRAVGAQRLEVGGVLSVTLVREEPATRGNPKKIYSATYTPPPAGVEQAAYLAEAMPAAPPAAASTSSAPGGWAAPGGTGAGVAVAPLPPPAGVDPMLWHGMTPDAQQRYLASMQAPPQGEPPF